MENCTLRKRHCSESENSLENSKKLKRDSSENTSDSQTGANVKQDDNPSESVTNVAGSNAKLAAENDAKNKQSINDIANVIDTELECGVCKELLIDSCVLPCGHIFCGYCIRMWLFNSETCPVCRSYTDFIISTRGLDHFLDLLVKVVKPDLAESRAEMTIERRAIIQRAEATWLTQQQQLHHNHHQQIGTPPSGVLGQEMFEEWIEANANVIVEDSSSNVQREISQINNNPNEFITSNAVDNNSSSNYTQAPNSISSTLPNMNMLATSASGQSISHHAHVHNFHSIPVLVTFPTAYDWLRAGDVSFNESSVANTTSLSTDNTSAMENTTDDNGFSFISGSSFQETTSSDTSNFSSTSSGNTSTSNSTNSSTSNSSTDLDLESSENSFVLDLNHITGSGLDSTNSAEESNADSNLSEESIIIDVE